VRINNNTASHCGRVEKYIITISYGNIQLKKSKITNCIYKTGRSFSLSDSFKLCSDRERLQIQGFISVCRLPDKLDDWYRS
jgi:hypothetical protein